MAGHSNTDKDNRQENEPRRQYQYYYNSSQQQPSQVPKSNYLYTNHTQTFDLAVDDQAQEIDVVMPDFPHPDYYVAPAEAYNDGWQNYRVASVGTASTSIVNVTTPSATTDGGHSSYVMVDSHHSRTYSEHSNRTSAHDSDGPVYSVPGDPEPWTPGSAYAVDIEAMEDDAQISSMPHDPKGVLVGLSSPGMSLQTNLVGSMTDRHRTKDCIQPIPIGRQFRTHHLPGILDALPDVSFPATVVHLTSPAQGSKHVRRPMDSS
jgi:hypothetical protein